MKFLMALSLVLTLLVHTVLATEDHSALNDTRSDSTGCVEWAYQTPHCCSPPHCHFMVGWRDRDQQGTIDFHLVATVTRNHSVWAALGLSDDRFMGNTDVVSCWLPEGEHPQFRQGWIQPGSRNFSIRDEPASYLKPSSVSVIDNQLHCRFSLGTYFNTSVLQAKGLTQPLHILAASGPLLSAGNELSMAPHTSKTASPCKCNVTDCKKTCVCMSDIQYLLLKLHGVVMTIAFVFFMPVGALVSRYYRIVFVRSWFKAHVTMMVFGVLCGLSGLGLVLAHTSGGFTVGYHQVVGVVCLSLTVVQPLVGLLRPAIEPTLRRKLFNIFHRVMALLILNLGVAALLLGVYIFHSFQTMWMLAALGLSVVTNMGFMLLLELLTRTQKFSITVLPPVGYHKVTKFDELSESEEEVYVRDRPSMATAKPKQKSEPYRFEQALLLLFVIQSFCFAVTIGGLIYFYDSSGMSSGISPGI